MAQRYSEFMTQPQIPGTGPTIQDFFSNRLFGNIRAGQPELGIYNTPQMQYLAEDDLESQNAGEFQPEEKGIISLRDIVGDIVSKGAAGFKDIAGRSIASQALGGAGGMIFGPIGALAGGLAGLFKGGDLFDGGGGMAPDLQRSLYGEYGADSIGRLGSGIMAGYNPRAGNLLNRAVQRRQNVLRSMKNIPGYKGLNYDPLTDFINKQVKEQTKYYGGTGATDVTGSSDYTSTGSPTSMGSAQGGAGGRPY